MKTYKTLKALKKALDTKQLKLKRGSRECIILDNDSTSLYVEDPKDPEDAIKIFDGGTPNDLLIEALDLLGIPWDMA